jgi:SWI/SNF-related matrix-associated actin-dependent regulator of chromatin subfamily B protein 1
MSTKTYGQKPKSFQLDDGERYYIGAEIGQYLKYGRGHLYKRFPQLYKRPATQAEKKKIQELGVSNAYTHSTVMLLREREVEELLEGQEDKFRASAAPAGACNWF